MKRFLASVLIAVSLTQSIPIAHADGDDLVTLVGALNPKFSVELTPGDLQALAESVKDFTALDPQAVDINSLFRPGDEVAIASARKTYAELFLASAQELVDMKAMVYKLAALLSYSDGKNFAPALYNAYQLKFQISYANFIERLGTLNKDVLSAISQCNSELCVTSIAEAQGELLQFADQLNRGIYLKKLSKLKLDWTFTDPMLKGILESTLDAFVPPNRAENFYSSIVLAAFTPFVAAARATKNIGTSILGFVATPNATHLTIHANPISLKISHENDTLGKYVTRRINEIVNSNPVPSSPVENGNKSKENRDRSAPTTRTTPYRVSVLVCQMPDSGEHFSGHVVLYGVMHFECYNNRLGDHEHYTIRMNTVGPGLAAYIGRRDAALFTIFITSPIPIIPQGKWFGASAGGIVVFFGAQAGEFVGKWGSTLHMIGWAAGLGGQIGLSQITIE